ncbi:hypothetical protein [Conservatibacter flavescens]|uniref:DNA gyrase subunit B n=1 Tax=Conservatibacter flavescens TaxID=28161 RepID=A0A2M8S2S9_9PAST|nr:hypothetical protein [Conservatibacter flavescens]PJG85408.1 hypothetical protein CVP05_06695 [Conservatibacter flavescens]
MSKGKLAVNILLTVVSIAFPLIWLFSPQMHTLSQILPYIMAILWGLKAMQTVRFQRFFAIFMACLLVFISVTRNLDTMYWYPVIISGVMLFFFGSSLFSAQSLIERLARLQTPELPPQAVRYTRKVTQVWCGFFVFNIAVTSHLIVQEQYQYWALYSGVISYILMGMLFVGEWGVRKIVMAKNNS